MIPLFQTKYDWEKIDPDLIQCYKDNKRPKIQELSDKTGVPVSSLCHRALNTLNVRGPKEKRSRTLWFSEQEDQIIIANALNSVPFIIKKLRHAGFNSRREKSIFNRMSHLRNQGKLLTITEEIEDRDLFTTAILAQEMGIDHSKIFRWIKLNYLKAKEQPRLPESQKTHRYLIKRKDVKEFLVRYQRHYDHTLCRHSFLIDVLVGDMSLMIQESCGRAE